MKNGKVFLAGMLALAVGMALFGCKNGSTDEYTVTYDVGSGSGAAPASQTVEDGTAITLPDQGRMTAPSGKSFDGWKDGGGAAYAAGAGYTVTADVTFTAQWIITVNTDVVVNADGLTATNGVFDIDAAVTSAFAGLSGTGKVKITLGATEKFGISMSNWNDSRVEYVSGIRAWAKGITTEAELNALPASVEFATSPASVSLTPSGTAVAFARAGGASLTPFWPGSVKQWTNPDGTVEMQRTLTKDIVVFYDNEAGVIDGDTAKSILASRYNITPKAGQVVGTSAAAHMTVLPWFRVEISNDLDVLVAAVSTTGVDPLPTVNIPGLGHIDEASIGATPTFTADSSVTMGKQYKQVIQLG
jgi:hypothetical protein